MNARFKSRAMAGEYEQKKKTCSIVLRGWSVGSNLLLVSCMQPVLGCHAVAFVTREILRDDPNIKYLSPLLFS